MSRSNTRRFLTLPYPHRKADRLLVKMGLKGAGKAVRSLPLTDWSVEKSWTRSSILMPGCVGIFRDRDSNSGYQPEMPAQATEPWGGTLTASPMMPFSCSTTFPICVIWSLST